MPMSRLEALTVATQKRTKCPHKILPYDIKLEHKMLPPANKQETGPDLPQEEACDVPRRHRSLSLQNDDSPGPSLVKWDESKISSALSALAEEQRRISLLGPELERTYHLAKFPAKKEEVRSTSLLEIFGIEGIRDPISNQKQTSSVDQNRIGILTTWAIPSLVLCVYGTFVALLMQKDIAN
eukprot:3427150-Rhodomonas_salina.1